MSLLDIHHFETAPFENTGFMVEEYAFTILILLSKYVDRWEFVCLQIVLKFIFVLVKVAMVM